MIPKRAMFYWSGPPMSWLRQQSIETFKKHNPDWEVVLLGGDYDSDSFKLRVIHSDLVRYENLHTLGGMYFDTDIIFTAPIPDEWRSKDNAIVARDGLAQGIACLGAKQGSRLFGSLVDRCNERLQSKIILAYQSLGIKLFADSDVRRMAANFGESIFQIPIERLFAAPWSGVELLWSDTPMVVPGDAVGVHWFGGDEISREMEPKITPDTLDKHPCLLTRMLKSEVAA